MKLKKINKIDPLFLRKGYEISVYIGVIEKRNFCRVQQFYGFKLQNNQFDKKTHENSTKL